MSEKKQEQKGETLQLTPDDLKELVATAIREAKRNEDAEAAKAAKKIAREQYEDREADERKWKALRVANCNHKKGKDQDKWQIAWAIYPDRIARGYCPKCEGIFEPGSPRYEELRALSAFDYDLSPIG
jgi:hypothetical protein